MFLFFSDEPQVSIFTLAQLLNTQPEVPFRLARRLKLWRELIEEVDDDEWFEEQDGKEFYQSTLAENGE